MRSYSSGYFNKILELQENSLLSRGSHVKCSERCENIVKHCTATFVLACIFSTYILIKAQDWVKQSQNRTDEIGSFDDLNKLVYAIFRSFVRTQVTFWKHHTLKKPGCYWLPVRLRFLSHFYSLGNVSPNSLKRKDFNKCKIKTKIPSISFLFEKNLCEFKICYTFEVFFWSIIPLRSW